MGVGGGGGGVIFIYNNNLFVRSSTKTRSAENRVKFSDQKALNMNSSRVLKSKLSICIYPKASLKEKKT